jgi:hypothetical protein
VVDPGRHVLLGQADGFLPRTVEVDVPEGERRSVTLDLERAPSTGVALTGSTTPASAGHAAREPPVSVRATRPAAAGDTPAMSTGRVLLGAGIGGIAAGLATGALALSVRPAEGGTPAQADAYRRLRNLSVASLGGGGAALLGGLALEWAADRSPVGARKSSGMALLGAGVAGLAVGAVSGGMNLGVNSHLRSACPDKICPASERPNAESARHLGIVSIASFGLAAASLGLGATLLLSDGGTPSTGARGPLLVAVTPSGLALRGTW